MDLHSSITITLPGDRSYPVRFAPLAAVPALLDDAGLRRGRCLVVTDANVAALHLPPLREALEKAGWTPRLLVLSPGEATKAPAPLQAIYDEALAWGIDRQTPLLALGGGVVGDVAGFAAATLLRGLPLVQLPTTLIAQVDSALGGKTGINHAQGKNLVGAFYQPKLVGADLSTLATLPEREWTSGLAEVVKHALIADVALFEFLETHTPAVLAREADAVAEMVPRAARVKAEIVSQDEREQGRRAILNFGHTFGHAIEREAGYGRFTHGEAVALGMKAALHLSHALHPDFPLARARALVEQIPIPAGYADLDRRALTEALQFDKKIEAGTLRFVVLRRLGAAYVTAAVDRALLDAAWSAALSE